MLCDRCKRRESTIHTTRVVRGNIARLELCEQWAEEKGTGREKEKSVLAEAATDLAQVSLPAAYEVDDLVTQIAETLTGETPRSVLLVGPSGVGKTAAVYELVRSRAARQLGHTPFWETNGARLVAGMSGFGMWQDRCQKLCGETLKQRAVVRRVARTIGERARFGMNTWAATSGSATDWWNYSFTSSTRT